MRIIDEVHIRSSVTVAAAREAVHDAFCALAEGKVVAPHEFAMKLNHGGEVHIKGAYLGGEVLAFKVATGQFPGGGNSGFTSVIDAATGEPIALLQDGGWLTEMRTAAAAAVAAKALARPDVAEVAILGGGIQAAFQVEALRDVFALDAVRVWSRSSETRERFARENDADACSSVAEAVDAADIVVCCTPSIEPLVDLAMIDTGVHVTAVGSDMTGKRELAADLVAAADVLVADSVEVASSVGELQHAPGEVARAVSLGDVLTGSASGRTTNDQITIADLCGLGIQDAALAQLVMSIESSQ